MHQKRKSLEIYKFHLKQFVFHSHLKILKQSCYFWTPIGFLHLECQTNKIQNNLNIEYHNRILFNVQVSPWAKLAFEIWGGGLNHRRFEEPWCTCSPIIFSCCTLRNTYPSILPEINWLERLFEHNKRL